MNRIKVFGLLAVIVVMASIGSVAAFGGKFSIIYPQGQEKIINAIKANNYTAWKEAISAQLTEENFNNITQRYQAMSQRHENMSEKRGAMSSETRTLTQEMNQAIKDGNYTKVKELSAQLGLTGGYGKHRMFGDFGRGRMI